MKNYINALFLINCEFNQDILSSNLYISFDDYSALRGDYMVVLNEIKKYSSVRIIKENERKLQEGYEQGLYILNCDGLLLFLRLILRDNEIYDALIYTINDMDLINRVFFSSEVAKIPVEFKNALKNEKTTLIVKNDNDKYYIVMANKSFYNEIRYEDWDYENKYQNCLNPKILDFTDIKSFKFLRSDNSIVEFSFDETVIDNLILLISK